MERLKDTMLKKDAIERIVELLIQHLTAGPDKARYAAEKIYSEVVAPSVEDERDDFIRLAKYPDNLN